MEVVGILAAVILAVLIVRLFGAWMLRIDVVIKELKQINKQLNK